MRRWHVAIVLIALAGLCLFPPAQTYWRLLTVQIALSALLAISFDVCLGFTGMLTMGTALFFGLGAFFFSYALMALGLEMLGALAVTQAGILLVSLCVGALAVRLRGPSFLILTLILVIAVQHVAQNWRAVTNGDDGIPLDGEIFRLWGVQITSLGRYYFGLALFAVGYLATVALVRSPLGLLMRGVRGNDFRTELLGHNSHTIKLIAFCWSAQIAGLAGAAYATALGHIHAGLFDPAVSGQAMLWAFFGGIGTLVGPLIGAAVLVPFEDLMGSMLGYPKLFTGILLVSVVVLLHRGGVIGFLERLTLRRSRPQGTVSATVEASA